MKKIEITNKEWRIFSGRYTILNSSYNEFYNRYSKYKGWQRKIRLTSGYLFSDYWAAEDRITLMAEGDWLVSMIQYWRTQNE